MVCRIPDSACSQSNMRMRAGIARAPAERANVAAIEPLDEASRREHSDREQDERPVPRKVEGHRSLEGLDFRELPRQAKESRAIRRREARKIMYLIGHSRWLNPKDRICGTCRAWRRGSVPAARRTGKAIRKSAASPDNIAAATANHSMKTSGSMRKLSHRKLPRSAVANVKMFTTEKPGAGTSRAREA